MANDREKEGGWREEASAIGERAKGAVKDAVGAVTGNRNLEREGERENQEGRARQAANNATGTAGNWITGTFSDRNSAEQAYKSMLNRGYSQKEVNLMMSDDTRKRYFSGESDDSGLGNKAMEGAGVGGAIGSVAGGLLGALAAIGTNAIVPGLGIVVAGPLLAGLAGAGAGGVTGGVLGALVGMGIPEERAQVYDQDIKNGGIVLGVTPRTSEDADYFEREWKGYRGRNIYR